jgi:hypothetical protein
MQTSVPRFLAPVLAGLGHPGAQLLRAIALAGREEHGRAFPLFAGAARAGLAEAEYQLGRCYLLGLGVPPGINEALRWLRRAADQGHREARTQLAGLALQGVGPRDGYGGGNGLFGLRDGPAEAPDYDAAERWARLAAADGSAEAMALLAFVLTEGPQDRRDEAAGLALYRESAALGWSRGQLGLAMRLLRDGNPGSAAEAQGLFAAAAADGVAVAHFMLGALAESGAAGTPDPEAAASAYRSAAELGHATAQMRWGFALLHGRGVAKDAFSAETWLRRAATGGEAQAASVLGHLLAEGNGSPPNPGEAAVWFQRAAEAGHAASARALGRMKLQGQGVPPDLQEAAHWLRLAADGGDTDARSDLAVLALHRKVEPGKVAEWLREAAEAGDPEAQFKLGLCFAEGVGMALSVADARVWFLRAAEQGHDGGRMAAGEMLANGRGGPADQQRAVALFEAAAAAGHAGAHYALGMLGQGDAAARFGTAAALGHAEAAVMLGRLRAPA